MIEQLTYIHGVFYFRCEFQNRYLAQEADLEWDRGLKVWKTTGPHRAANLIEFANSKALPVLETYQKSIEASLALDSDMEFPVPQGLEARPYQKGGAEFLVRHDSAILADEMGLGKTIQAILAINFLELSKILITCPTSLADNWAREIAKWSTRKLKTQVVRSGKDIIDLSVNILIVSYPFFSRLDSFSKLEPFIRLFSAEIFISDEAHALKNLESIRTASVLGFHLRGDKKRPGMKFNGVIQDIARRWFLTGTPVENRPVELYPILKKVAPHVIDGASYWNFAIKYNGAYEDGWGMKLGSGTNTEELQAKLRSSIMVRRLKRDVLKDLPEKNHHIFYLEKSKVIEKLISQESTYADVLENGEREEAPTTGELARIRKELAIAKVSASLEFITNMLESVDKVVIFAIHKKVVSELRAKLKKFNPVVITGEVPAKDRQGIVDSFQTDPAVRVFIGNIDAAGVGSTLTAAHNVIFIEMSWVPGKNDQAVDRCHRITQTMPVDAYFLTVEGSLDDRVLNSNQTKRRDINHTLDPEYLK